MAAAAPLPGEAGYKSPWLHAHTNALASIKTNSGGCELVDLEGNGEHQLLVADYDQKLLVFRGTRPAEEHPLIDIPVAICAFYSDDSKPRIPAVGVASGPNVYIYRNLRPLRKFTAPAVSLEPEELSIWSRLKKAELTAVEAREAIKKAHDDGCKMTAKSLALLALDDDLEALEAHVARAVEQPLQHETTITCMTTLATTSVGGDEDDHHHHQGASLSGLVIGTESKLLILMDPTATSKLCEITLSAVPTMLCASGSYEHDWRVVVACRDCRVYTVSIGEHRGTAVIRKPHIELESHVVGLARVSPKSIVLATADSQVHSYLQKGRKNFSLRMPAPVTNLECMTIRKMSVLRAVLVALSSGEVRIYRDKDLVDVIRVNDVVSAICCGPYGREDNTLIIITRSGALMVKMLPRSADLAKNAANRGGPPPEQDIPLDIPKKSRLYLEQTQREKDDCAGIHRRFQYNSLKLKLTAAQAYSKLESMGELGSAKTGRGDGSLHMSARVNGLGPFFHIVIELRVGGQEALGDIPIVVLYNLALYRMPKALTKVSLLIPGVTYNVLFEIECIDESAPTEPLTILVLPEDETDHVPLVCSTLTMPQSELLDEPVAPAAAAA